MEIKKPNPIVLTPEEKILLNKINFHPRQFGAPDPDPDGSNAGALARSLLQRQAIPEIRLRYFTDPELNIGGRGKSRKEVFEKNGTKGDAILKHGNFLVYLRYFIFGPDLPSETISKLIQVVDDDLGTSGMILDQLLRVSRAEARHLPREKRQDAPEEFFKLTIEIGIDLGQAASIRDAVRSVTR